MLNGNGGEVFFTVWNISIISNIDFEAFLFSVQCWIKKKSNSPRLRGQKCPLPKTDIKILILMGFNGDILVFKGMSVCILATKFIIDWLQEPRLNFRYLKMHMHQHSQKCLLTFGWITMKHYNDWYQHYRCSEDQSQRLRWVFLLFQQQVRIFLSG